MSEVSCPGRYLQQCDLRLWAHPQMYLKTDPWDIEELECLAVAMRAERAQQNEEARQRFLERHSSAPRLPSFDDELEEMTAPEFSWSLIPGETRPEPLCIQVPTGRFVVSGPKAIWTIRISTVRHTGSLVGNRIVEMMQGAPTMDAFAGVASISADHVLRPWARCRSWPALRVALYLITGNRIDGYHVAGESRCRACGRALSTSESLKAGIGPECRSKGT